MEAHCVSSSESAGEKDDEIRARRLEEWKRWFWEGVDEDIPSENEKVVELPEDMPEELRQLGGIREFSSSCFVTPEQEKASVDVISEKERDQNVSESPRETDGSPKEKIYSRSLCFLPKSLPSSPKKRSLSEPTFSTTSLVEWYQWHENIHIKLTNLKQENQRESKEAKRSILPRLPQPYALLPTTTPRKPKTQYEALAWKRRTDQGTKESPPKRSTPASPPLTAILALERASVSRVIPFKDIRNEIEAIVGEPRNAYPTETPLPEQLSRTEEHSRADIYSTDESASRALMVLTGDKLAGGPLREYLEKTRNKKALRSLQFWEDAQRYLSPADYFGSFDKFHMAKTLVATYIAPDSPRQLPISLPIRDDLMRLLPGEKGDHLLTSVVDECTQEVVFAWSEYVRSDEDHFISSVTMRKKDGSKAAEVKAKKMRTKIRAEKERKAFFPVDINAEFRALALAAQLGVNAIVGRDDEDNEEAEAFNDEFKIPSLKDHEKEMEVLHARKRRMSHFYGKTFKKGEDTAELAKTTAPTKMKTPKPRSFNEALFEPVQFTAFKKFLAERNAEVPLAFWQAVENMKTNCKDVKARLARAATIVRKFFINIPMSAVEYLNCKADIIRDIPTLDKVTPAMLISAQACVSRSIEENWYSQYMATFPEDEDEEENFAKYAMRNTLAGVCKLTGYGKTIGLWRMVAHSIKLLQQGIHNPEVLEEFKQFLRQEAKATIEQNQKRHAPHPTRRMVNSKLVSVDRLVSDVEFWLEVERFKNLADHAAECARSGNYTLEDENLLLGKAKAIVKCFIDSDVPPRLQVNIPNETAESIVALVQNDIIERGLFHDAAMSVFIPLMFFWKKFSAERISSPPEEVTPSAPSAGANKRLISRGPSRSLICGIPYQRVYTSIGDDVFWSYSLNHGLRLVLPLKFRIAKRVGTQLGHRSTGLSDVVSLSRSTP
ncbi:regulator of G-protein signaling protein-like isoform X1 [Acropora millepora]|uniref:regulator of G-protein signaling protein-like isoform X1 n=1 Tax=Acropora millepora TaxID=45264 RepID=UPI001CF59794|nr:regulator of G-protein signaling protein-like isoform X1 [Acropora millepora]